MKQIKILKTLLIITGLLLLMGSSYFYIFEFQLYFTGITFLTLGTFLLLFGILIRPTATTDQEKISRIEIIDEKGRAFVKWNIEIQDISRQDGGKTIKIFIKDKAQNPLSHF